MNILQAKASCDDCKQAGTPTELIGPLTLRAPKDFAQSQTMVYAFGELLARMGQHSQIAANSSQPDAPTHTHFTVSTLDGKRLGAVKAFEQEEGLALWLDEFAAEEKSTLRAEVGIDPPSVEHGR